MSQTVMDIGKIRIITGVLIDFVSGGTLSYAEYFKPSYVTVATFSEWQGCDRVSHSGRSHFGVARITSSNGTAINSDFTVVGVKA